MNQHLCSNKDPSATVQQPSLHTSAISAAVGHSILSHSNNVCGPAAAAVRAMTTNLRTSCGRTETSTDVSLPGLSRGIQGSVHLHFALVP